MSHHDLRGEADDPQSHHDPRGEANDPQSHHDLRGEADPHGHTMTLDVRLMTHTVTP